MLLAGETAPPSEEASVHADEWRGRASALAGRVSARVKRASIHNEIVLFFS